MNLTLDSQRNHGDLGVLGVSSAALIEQPEMAVLVMAGLYQTDSRSQSKTYGISPDAGRLGGYEGDFNPFYGVPELSFLRMDDGYVLHSIRRARMKTF